MALYPYTMKPIALNLTDAEFQQAQYELFEQTSPSFSLKSIKLKEWIGLGLVTIAALSGIFFIDGYSTIIFWIMLVLVVIYLLVRTFGMQWYIKREFEKQMNGQEIPDEMHQMQLGVQKHGLIISMPAPNAGMQPKTMRGMQVNTRPTQQAVIPWDAVTSWDETDDYIYMLFELKGQNGSQIIPKRLQADKFPIDSVRNHLQEAVPIRGLRPDTLPQ